MRLVRTYARDDLIEDDAERIDVRCRRHRESANLLRACVVGRQRTGHHSGGREAAAGVAFEELGNAEIHDFRNVVRGDEDVGRLQVAVNHAVLVRVLHGTAHGAEQLQSLLERQRVVAAVLGQRHALDVLHDQERLPSARRPAVEQPDDVVVVERGENLSFHQEAAAEIAVGDCRSRQLDGDLLREQAISAFRPEYLAHAAFADLLHQPVRPDLEAEARDVVLVVRRSAGSSQAIVRHEQRLDLVTQIGTIGARLADDSSAALRVEPDRRGEYRLDAPEVVAVDLPAAGIGWGHRPPSLNARKSHARANVQCLLTVAGEISIRSAVAETERPAKYRSSTTRAFSGATVPSAVSASSTRTKSSRSSMGWFRIASSGTAW